MIIGVAGHPAAGKDSVAEHFSAKGFRHISMGDFLRVIMKENNIPTDRAHVHEFVSAMRAKHGNSYPATTLAEVVEGKTVVSGFRNTAEIAVFREKFGKEFILLAVDATVEVRYQRITERKRIGDDISLERFKQEEEAERDNASGSHEMDKVIASADVIIENNGTKEEFFKKLEAGLKHFGI